METYDLLKDVKVFGFQVNTFPNGIKDAFDVLVNILPSEDERYFYGISECTRNSIIYKASALEIYDGEGQKYGFETYTIEKGEYLAVRVFDWSTKTDSIKNVFEEIFKDARADISKPCIELYKNMSEMMCMVKIDSSKELISEFENAAKELTELISSMDQEQINKLPFEGSWTAGQLAQHLIKSNSGFLEIINGPVKETERSPNEMVETIKADFLDFSTKTESPDFVVPENTYYQKEALLGALEDIRKKVNQVICTLDLTKTCLAFELPVYGTLTRLEAINFIIYHSKRHIHQLKNIYQRVT